MIRLIRVGIAVLLMTLLAGCQAGLLNTPAPTSHATTPASPTQPGNTGETPELVSTATVQSPAVGSPALTLWVPPQFDPESGEPAGTLLKEQISSFSQANPGVQVRVRIKPVSGPGGLLESLISASAAAPASLPDLVALPRESLETAALKGLISPLDGLSTLPEDPDWYPYARALGEVQGSPFGLPFAADALAVVYRPGQVHKAPTDWDVLTQQPVPLAYAGNAPTSLFTLGLIVAAGDPLQDSQGRPSLQPELLTKVLTLLQDAGRKGVFPNWSYQFQDDNQVWGAYNDKQASAAVTWVSRYLSERPPDTALVPIPSADNESISLANGWAWALSTPLAEHRTSSVQLAEYLTSSEFLANFSLAAGYLPPRPSALAAWNDRSLQAMISPIELAAQAQPNYDLINSLGPVVRDAVLQVLKDQVNPNQAAQAAATRLKGP